MLSIYEKEQGAPARGVVGPVELFVAFGGGGAVSVMLFLERGAGKRRFNYRGCSISRVDDR